MIYRKSTICTGVLFGLVLSSSISSAEKPNVIIILTDDMGFSDIGFYGGEIPTPNIDELAQNGLRFRNFYNASRSCPTRASLLTGLYQHQTGVGNMSSEGGSNFDFGVEGYRGFLNKNCVTIAEVVKEAGYHTYMAGKWHLGSDTHDKRPLSRGFERFYGTHSGALSYFDPKGLRCLFDNWDTIPAPPGFYSTDAFTDKAIEYIDENRNDKKPFFLYLSYNAPHWPLHAKSEDIELFRGKYLKGWDKLREERLEKQKKLGLFSDDIKLTPRDKRVRAWDEVSEEQKIKSDYRMAVYAAQIYCIDYNVGRLITYLKEINQFDNTLIMFMSDNGACSEPDQEFGGGTQADINNPEKSGPVSYGIGWANLSNTPFKLYKNNAYEGGIATPFIVHWPAEIKSQRGKFTDVRGHILNIMPTVVEVTGANYPQVYNGHTIQPMEDISLLPTFLKGTQQIKGYHFFEHTNNCAVIKGEWKAISRIGTDKWFLYNLNIDREELNDISLQYPDITADLSSAWHEWAIRAKVFPKGTKQAK